MIIEVIVVPGSGGFSIEQKNGEVRIRLKSQAEKNRANIELVKMLSRELHCSVRIIRGLTSKRKTLEISADEEEWKNYLQGH